MLPLCRDKTSLKKKNIHSFHCWNNLTISCKMCLFFQSAKSFFLKDILTTLLTSTFKVLLLDFKRSYGSKVYFHVEELKRTPAVLPAVLLIVLFLCRYLVSDFGNCRWKIL